MPLFLRKQNSPKLLHNLAAIGNIYTYIYVHIYTYIYIYVYAFVTEFCFTYYNHWPLWFRARVSYPRNHVTHWLSDQVIFLKIFISTFARTTATNFSKAWLKLSWPLPLRYVTHLWCGHVIFPKRCISSFTTPMTIKLGKVIN